jgi:hypothetical protein
MAVTSILRYAKLYRGPVEGSVAIWYDGAIMMSRTQITLDTQDHRRARQRANELGISLAEYLRRLVARDLAGPQSKRDVTAIFDLGSSGGSNIALNKDAMIGEAFEAARKMPRRR